MDNILTGKTTCLCPQSGRRPRPGDSPVHESLMLLHLPLVEGKE